MPKIATRREDESTGAVPLGTLKGDALANALMKAETKAKWRVTLSIAGLGWLDETERETIPRPDVSSANPRPLPAGEDGSTSHIEQHPTADEITTLVESARAANVDLDAFGHDMRRLMQLPDSQKITKKFRRDTMTVSQYNTARAHYGDALRVLLEEDVPDHEPPTEPVDADASQVVHAPTEESLHVDPSAAALSSAPEPSPGAATVDPAYHKLYQEALGWGIAEPEIQYILSHYPMDKARSLLWKHRKEALIKVQAATTIEAAAD